MAGNSAFEMVSERGWRRGLANLLNNEFGRWWRTNRWWSQALIWAGMIGFLMGAVVTQAGMKIEDLAMLYCIFASLGPSIAITIIMQGAVVGEKQSGTAAWVLSKPASRPAFILAKLVAGSLGSLGSMVLAPGLVGYGILSYATGKLFNPLVFLGGLGVIWLVILFWLAFTLMLGTLFKSRGAVIGISLALLLLQQNLIGLIRPLQFVLPWTLVVPLNDSNDAIVPNLLLGRPVTSFLPLVITLLEILIFVAISLWRFEKEEF